MARALRAMAKRFNANLAVSDSTEVPQYSGASDDPLDPWCGLDPLRVVIEMCDRGICADLINSDVSVGKSWQQLTGYQRVFYIFKFQELPPSTQQEVLTAVASAPVPRSDGSGGSHAFPARGSETKARKPKSTLDDFIRLFHMYKDPSLASLWSQVLSNGPSSNEAPRRSKQYYLEHLVAEFNDYEKNNYLNCTFDLIALPDGTVAKTPKPGMEAAYRACKSLNPSCKSRRARNVDWPLSSIKEMKRDLLAVNYVRYINSGLPEADNPYIPFKQYVTNDAKQKYALHLFDGFVDVILQEDELSRGLGRASSSCWLYFDRITVMGAVRAQCRYCRHTFAVNTCRLMAHVSGRATASISNINVCTKTPASVKSMLSQEFDNEQMRKKKNKELAHTKEFACFKEGSTTAPMSCHLLAYLKRTDNGGSSSRFSSSSLSMSPSVLEPLSDLSANESDTEGLSTVCIEDVNNLAEAPKLSNAQSNESGADSLISNGVSVLSCEVEKAPASSEDSTSLPTPRLASAVPIGTPDSQTVSSLCSLTHHQTTFRADSVSTQSESARRKMPPATPITQKKRRVSEASTPSEGDEGLNNNCLLKTSTQKALAATSLSRAVPTLSATSAACVGEFVEGTLQFNKEPQVQAPVWSLSNAISNIPDFALRETVCSKASELATFSVSKAQLQEASQVPTVQPKITAYQPTVCAAVRNDASLFQHESPEWIPSMQSQSSMVLSYPVTVGSSGNCSAVKPLNFGAYGARLPQQPTQFASQPIPVPISAPIPLPPPVAASVQRQTPDIWMLEANLAQHQQHLMALEQNFCMYRLHLEQQQQLQQQQLIASNAAFQFNYGSGNCVPGNVAYGSSLQGFLDVSGNGNMYISGNASFPHGYTGSLVYPGLSAPPGPASELNHQAFSNFMSMVMPPMETNYLG